jgi:uncharacterized membrane protein YfcA
MGLAAVLTIFVVGLAVGLLSGLVGIGGGVLIVPFLYFFYGHPEWFGVPVSAETATVVAHATSLFVIVPTSLRGALAYQKARLVEWRAVWPIGLASVFAAVLGARLAVELPPPALKIGFGLLLVVSAWRLGRRRQAVRNPAAAVPLRLSLPVTVGVGTAVGLFSALLGVGGGVVAIPLLLSVVRLDVRRVAATSIGIIAITATAGTVSYMISGWHRADLPPWSIGYVHVAAGLAMFAGSILSVRWGAALNQRLAPRALSLMFAALFLIIGLRLLIQNVGYLSASL